MSGDCSGTLNLSRINYEKSNFSAQATEFLSGVSLLCTWSTYPILMRAYGALCEIDLSNIQQMGKGRSNSNDNNNNDDVNLYGGGGSTKGAIITQVMMYHFDCHIFCDHHAYLHLLI